MRTWLVIGLLAVSPLRVQSRAAGEYQRKPQQLFCVTIPIQDYPSAAPEQNTPQSQNGNSLCKRFLDAVVTNWPLIVIGGLGVWAALRTLRAIQQQGSLMEKELVIANRAYLSVGEPEKSLIGQAKFPIENYGHVAACITSVGMEIIVQDKDDREVYRRHIIKETTETVVPGKDVDFALFVELPKEADNGQLIFSATILYDTGFNSTDTLRFIRVYSTQVSKWVKAWNGIGIDFTK